MWKSPLHQELAILNARRELKQKLYERFGYRKTQETRLIGHSALNKAFTAWAQYHVNLHPTKWHITLTANYVPPQVKQSKEWKEAMAHEDPNVPWLLERIANPVTEDHVPKSFYPNFLENMECPKWPFNPYEAQWMQEHFGLLKYPFVRKSKRDLSRGNFTGATMPSEQLTLQAKPEPLV